MKGTKVIDNKAVEAAAMTWAEATWIYNYGHIGTKDEVDTTEIWLQAQMDANERLKEMTIDDEEAYIHQYQINYEKNGTVIDPTLKTDSDILNAILVAWADIKWHIQHDGSLAYPEDAVQYDWRAWESMHNYIEEAGGERAYYNSVMKVDK